MGVEGKGGATGFHAGVLSTPRTRRGLACAVLMLERRQTLPGKCLLQLSAKFEPRRARVLGNSRHVDRTRGGRHVRCTLGSDAMTSPRPPVLLNGAHSAPTRTTLSLSDVEATTRADRRVRVLVRARNAVTEAARRKEGATDD